MVIEVYKLVLTITSEDEMLQETNQIIELQNSYCDFSMTKEL